MTNRPNRPHAGPKLPAVRVWGRPTAGLPELEATRKLREHQEAAKAATAAPADAPKLHGRDDHGTPAPAPTASVPAVARTGSALAVVPVQLQEIAEAAGQAAAWAIVGAKGGSEIWIPLRAEPGHWLTELLGAEAAEKVCAHYRVTNADGHLTGNMRIYVPQAGTGLLDIARQQVCDDVAAGMSVREAARRARLSERTAHRALGKTRDPRQGDLFAPRD